MEVFRSNEQHEMVNLNQLSNKKYKCMHDKEDENIEFKTSITHQIEITSF